MQGVSYLAEVTLEQINKHISLKLVQVEEFVLINTER